MAFSAFHACLLGSRPSTARPLEHVVWNFSRRARRSIGKFLGVLRSLERISHNFFYPTELVILQRCLYGGRLLASNQAYYTALSFLHTCMCIVIEVCVKKWCCFLSFPCQSRVGRAVQIAWGPIIVCLNNVNIELGFLLPPKRRRVDVIKVQKAMLPSPSTFAKEWMKVQSNESNHLCCHRPGRAMSTHVCLFYPGFATFVDECNSVDIDATDPTFIMELTLQMSNGFEDEAARMDCVRSLLNGYFKLGTPISRIRNTDGLIQFRNPLSVLMFVRGKGRLRFRGGE